MSEPIKTQGTSLFFVNPLGDAPEVIKLNCPTGITGMTAGAKSQINATCLEELEDEQFVAGLGTPGTASVPFIFNPNHPSHRLVLDTLKASGKVVRWLVGFSDGTAVPTLSESGVLVPPPAPGRTSAEFNAYVADVDIDISTNEIVRGTLTLQRSGKVQWNWNGPTA